MSSLLGECFPPCTRGRRYTYRVLEEEERYGTPHLLTDDPKTPHLLTDDLRTPHLLTDDPKTAHLLTDDPKTAHLLTDDPETPHSLTNDPKTAPDQKTSGGIQFTDDAEDLGFDSCEYVYKFTDADFPTPSDVVLAPGYHSNRFALHGSWNDVNSPGKREYHGNNHSNHGDVHHNQDGNLGDRHSNRDDNIYVYESHGGSGNGSSKPPDVSEPVTFQLPLDTITRIESPDSMTTNSPQDVVDDRTRFFKVKCRQTRHLRSRPLTTYSFDGIRVDELPVRRTKSLGEWFS